MGPAGIAMLAVMRKFEPEGKKEMAKVSDDAAQELPLNNERIEPKKLNRHVVIALDHMNKRRITLRLQIDKLTKEVEELDAAIGALGK